MRRNKKTKRSGTPLRGALPSRSNCARDSAEDACPSSLGVRCHGLVLIFRSDRSLCTWGEPSRSRGDLPPCGAGFPQVGGTFTLVGETFPRWGRLSPRWGEPSPWWGRGSPRWGKPSPGLGKLSPGWIMLSPKGAGGGVRQPVYLAHLSIQLQPLLPRSIPKYQLSYL